MKGFGTFLVVIGILGILGSFSKQASEGLWNDTLKGGIMIFGIGVILQEVVKAKERNQQRAKADMEYISGLNQRAETRRKEEAEQAEMEQFVLEAQAATLRLENQKREQELELERLKVQQYEQGQEARQLEEKRIEAIDKEKWLVAEQRALEEKRIEAIDKEKWLAAEQRALEEAKLEAVRLENRNLELEDVKRQNHLLSYPLVMHIDTFLKNYDELSKMALNGEQENKVLALYLKLKDHLQKNSKIPLDQREQVARDIMLINQNRTIVDLYSEEIRRVKRDPDLDDDEDEREAKINHWKDLRQKHVEAIQSKVEPR